ncbi:MAG: hypothetical protein A2664_02740 [Candidatus Taylorbacteria bacterium RIFCSPHIGHO2_01_FULL_46_22b]|uniref:Uncharacterized protein n=1 Tax=Candidatus Taylorbacteria bacterium RIFCSPHIGHO2_01_FULL_46_22b TaxID=1802301 RepID=A0A1G2M3Q4_9BACT|nr:MAG: hypothetical protein A2664_02740 [Candidatus Taylorbacteria bacterium RIFCSPHIGHO2_01_FULL_46_22b]
MVRQFLDNDVVNQMESTPMSAYGQFSIRIEGGSAVITKDNDEHFSFIGASCPVSTTPFNHYALSVSVAPQKGTRAVVVIGSSNQPGKKATNTFLINLSWEGDKLIADMKNHFVPLPDRLVETGGKQFGFVVTYKDQRFTTFDSSEFNDADVPQKRCQLEDKGLRIVDDPNLLCRFLVNQATFEDLEAAATLDKRSQTERDLAWTRAQLEKCEVTLSQEREGSIKQGQKLRTCRAEFEACQQQRALTREALRSAESGLSRLYGEVATLREERRRVIDILYNQGESRTFWGWRARVKVRKLEDCLEVPTSNYIHA